MQRNLFVDLLAHEINGYWRFLLANIKHYLSHITEKVYTSEFVSLRRRVLRDCVNVTNFAFQIKCHFNVGHIFLQYCYLIVRSVCFQYKSLAVPYQCTGTNLFTYILNLCVHDYMEIQRNLLMNLLAHERNGYREILFADIKYYLSRITRVYEPATSRSL